MNILLNSALTLTYNQLSTFADLDNFWNLFDTAFGTQYNRSGAEILRLQWLSGDFSQLPQIEILDSSILGNANGAYASSNNQIYLSANFLATSTAEAISAVLLEEIGHFIDAQINLSDSAGDEGAIFADLVQGESLDTQTLQALKAEDDHATITVNGQVVAVEQNSGTIAFSAATYNINENGTPVTAVTVTRTGGSIGAVSATLNLTNGTANAPFDYQNTPITVNFADGETTKTVNFSQVSQGLSFDGVNDYVNIGAKSSLEVSNAITIEAWINPTDGVINITEGGIIVNKEGEYEVARFADGTIRWAFANDEPNWIWINTNYVAPLNQWTHIAVSYDLGVIKTYANGVLVHTYNGSGNIGDFNVNQDDFRIGGRQSFSQFFQGSIDDVCIWNKARTQAEIQANLNKELTGAESGLVGYWNFNSVKGNRVDDLTSNQNDGTIIEAQTTAGFGAISGTIPIVNDNLIEGNETVNLTLTNPTNGATIGTQNTATLTIVDNDTSPAELISENLPIASYTASSSWTSEGALPDKAFDGSALTSWNSGDYASQWIEVDLGQEHYLYSIQLLIAQQPSGSTTHEVWVSNQSISNSYTGATLAKTFQGFTDQGWLESDFSNSTKGRYVQVKTVSSPSWIAWVEIQIFGEPLDLPTITLAVSPSSVLEDGTTNLIYTFTRTGSTTSVLTVNYGITGTANTSDYTGATPGTGKTITFAAGSSTATLTIDPTADTIVESNETVALILATGTGYTIGTTAAVTGTITNDDLLPNLNLSANQTIVEGNTNPQNVTYTVTLSNASTQAITVQYATANGTAIAGSDYTSTSGTLTFNPGVTSQVINIPIFNDSLNEANETFTLNLASPINASLGTVKTATTTITDTLSASVTTTLPSGVENLTLTGTAAINGTGNAGDNVLQGNSANNTLTGLDGNDTYRFLANTALRTDTITETTTGGIDNLDLTGTTAAVNVNLGVATSQTVNSNLKLILSANNVIENATGGTGNDRLTGNALNNTLNGGSGNDQLQGLGGNDTLWGGAGNDILNGGTGNDSLWGGLGDDILTGGVGNDQYLFQSNSVFSTSLGVDYISEFEAGLDQIVLSKATFNAITNLPGQALTDFAVVSDDEFVNASNVRIVFSQGTGSLFYNQDGSILGTGTVFEFARLGNPDITLTSSNFSLIA